MFGKKLQPVEAPESAEPRIYTIILSNGPPMQIISPVDLLKQWFEQVERGRKIIQFLDEEGQCVACFAAQGLLGVIQGAIAPKKEK